MSLERGEGEGEVKASVCVTYKWNNQGVVCDTAGANTPIIEFIRQTLLKADPSATKKSGYLFIHAQKLNAIVNPWVPCGALEKGEILELDLKGMKPSDSLKGECKQDADKIIAPEMYRYPTFHGGEFFKVKYQGKQKGKIWRIIKEKKEQYYSIHFPMAVFGYLDQTINQALENDKRFAIPGPFMIEDSDCKKHMNSLLLSQLKDSLCKKNNDDMLLPKLESYTFTIIRYGNDQSKELKAREKKVNKALENNVKGDTSPLPGAAHKQPEANVVSAQQPVLSSLSTMFSNAYEKLANVMGQKNLESHIVTDYKKNALYKDPMTATTFRLLTNHLDNVALIRYNIGDICKSGTLFLLTETLGLTCYHVLKPLIESASGNIVEVIFNYENEENIVQGTWKGVVWYNEELDCAFVRVEITPSPPGLLGYLAPPPQNGAVSIIGHPRGQPKQIDPNCSVIAFSQRADYIFDTILSDRSFIHVLTQCNFKPMSDPTLVTTDTCLYWGASGGPVFDSLGELVAMHTEGYPIDTTQKKQSVIEYGRSAVDIIIHGAVHCKELSDLFRNIFKEKKNLSDYLQPGGPPVKMQPVVRQLRKLWGESDCQKEQSAGADIDMVSVDSQNSS